MFLTSQIAFETIVKYKFFIDFLNIEFTHFFIENLNLAILSRNVFPTQNVKIHFQNHNKSKNFMKLVIPKQSKAGVRFALKF